MGQTAQRSALQWTILIPQNNVNVQQLWRICYSQAALGRGLVTLPFGFSASPFPSGRCAASPSPFKPVCRPYISEAWYLSSINHITNTLTYFRHINSHNVRVTSQVQIPSPNHNQYASAKHQHKVRTSTVKVGAAHLANFRHKIHLV